MRPIREWEPSTENSPFLCTETPYYHFVGRNSYRSPLAPLPGPGSGGCQGASLNACARQNAYCTLTIVDLSLFGCINLYVLTYKGGIDHATATESMAIRATNGLHRAAPVSTTRVSAATTTTSQATCRPFQTSLALDRHRAHYRLCRGLCGTCTTDI